MIESEKNGRDNGSSVVDPGGSGNSYHTKSIDCVLFVSCYSPVHTAKSITPALNQACRVANNQSNTRVVNHMGHTWSATKDVCSVFLCCRPNLVKDRARKRTKAEAELKRINTELAELERKMAFTQEERATVKLKYANGAGLLTHSGMVAMKPLNQTARKQMARHDMKQASIKELENVIATTECEDNNVLLATITDPLYQNMQRSQQTRIGVSSAVTAQQITSVNAGHVMEREKQMLKGKLHDELDALNAQHRISDNVDYDGELDDDGGIDQLIKLDKARLNIGSAAPVFMQTVALGEEQKSNEEELPFELQ